MNELSKSRLKKPMDKTAMSNDSAMLRNLVAELNNPAITGAVVPKEEMTAPPPPPPKVEEPPKAEEPQKIAAPVLNIAFTGRMKSGKDYLARQLGATIFGLADPLSAVLRDFFGTEDKDAAGARAFLQTIGQWGRGYVGAQYPLTTERAVFIDIIRRKGAAEYRDHPILGAVNWSDFGKTADIWLNALLQRVGEFREENPGARVAITNIRFENEFNTLKNAGWQIWHVMAHPDTLAKRRAEAKMTDAKAVTDTSEELALARDQSVLKGLSHGAQTSKLRCVWCDNIKPSPSPRLFSVTDFLNKMGDA